MHIVHVCERYLPVVDGVTTHVSNLAIRQAESNRVTVVTSDLADADPFKPERVAITNESSLTRVQVIRIRTWPPYVPYWRLYSTGPRLLRTLKVLCPDVLHIHSAMLMSSDLAILASKFFSLPSVLTIHAFATHGEGPLRRAYMAAIGRHTFRALDQIIVLHHSVLDYLTARGVPPSMVKVIPNGIDWREFCDSRERRTRRFGSEHHGPFRLLFVGGLQPRKGVSVLIDAVEQIIRDGWDVTLSIVGKGELKDSLERHVESRNLERVIRFRGFLSRAAVLREFAEADLLVLPSYLEGSPTVILEAMGAGVPVLATRVGSVGELVAHGKSGYLVEPGDASALARGIKAVMGERDLQETLSMNGMETAKLHDWDTVTKSIAAVYDASRRARPGTRTAL